MIRRCFPWCMTGSFATFPLLLATGLALSQEPPKKKPSPVEEATPAAKAAPDEVLKDEAKRKAAIDKMIADFDLTPHPLAAIPDNPPPHEGAMVGLPLVVEPPDLIIVEVLEALPGRPISGERMVRPDGTMSLGFYGDIPVKGLTLAQVKVAVIKHLRKYLQDESLGLEVMEEVVTESPAPGRPPVAPLPQNAKPFNLDEVPKPTKKTSRATPSLPSSGKAHSRSASTRSSRRLVSVRPVAIRKTTQEPAEQPVPPKGAAQIQIPAGGSGRITITVDVVGPPRPVEAQVPLAPMEPSTPMIGSSWKVVRPQESLHVFIDVSAYNTMNYYVVGDVAVTGRLPWTGKETVLDALQFAGGFTSTADPKNIRLIRPARGGKTAKVYKVDYEAILDKGDVTANYQILPGDRLVVGRNEVVQKTVEIDRLNAPISTMTSMMLQEAYMLRALQLVSVDKRDELLREYVDFWAKALSHHDGVKFDEQTLREAFIRKMKLIPAPVTTTPAPR